MGLRAARKRETFSWAVFGPHTIRKSICEGLRAILAGAHEHAEQAGTRGATRVAFHVVAHHHGVRREYPQPGEYGREEAGRPDRHRTIDADHIQKTG